MVGGWQSLAPTRQNLSLEAHLRDTNFNLELLSGPISKSCICHTRETPSGANESLVRMPSQTDRFGASIAHSSLKPWVPGLLLDTVFRSGTQVAGLRFRLSAE